MDDAISTIIVLVVLAFQARAWIQRMRGLRTGAAAADEDGPASPVREAPDRPREAVPSVAPHLDPSEPAPAPRGLRSLLARRVGEVAGAVAAGERLEPELEELALRLRGVSAGGAVLAAVVTDHIEPRRVAVLGRARALLASLQSDNVATLFALSNDPMAFAPIAETEALVRQRDVLRTMADWRSDSALGRLLADADAIAASLLAPVQDRAGVQGLRFPSQRPICAPAGAEGEAIWLGLLPEGYPVLFVPDDFGEDLFRQASIAHEIGHLLWLRLPGFADEVRAITGFSENQRLLEWDGQTLRGSLDWPFGAWVHELTSDAVATLMLGPAALHGFIHSFARPDDPERVLIAGGDARGYREHPPAHLRVHLSAALLTRMGFDQEAKALVEDWDRLHGAPEFIALATTRGSLVSLPLEQLVEHGRRAEEALYGTPLACLDGVTLQDFPAFEMSPGMWARVQRRAADLIAGEDFHADGRTALAAAIVARARRPDLAARIERGLQVAVLGRDAHERHAADPHYQRRRGASAARQGLAHQVRDALLLAEILERPSARRRRA